MQCNTRINNKTNRCVLRDGEIGRHLIGRPKNCDSVLNHKTNRCILKNGVLNKKIAEAKKSKAKKSNAKKAKKSNAKKSKAKSAKKSVRKASAHKLLSLCVPTKFEDIANKCACRKKWLIKEALGSGQYGKVYGACLVNDCRYAVKVQKFDAYGKAEVNAYMHFKARKIRVGPKFHSAWVCRNKLYIVLERMKKCNAPRNKAWLNRVKHLADTLEKKGWLHADIHTGNIMCTQNNRMVLIDFGWAVQKGKGPYANHRGRTYEFLKRNQAAQIEELLTTETTKSIS